MGLKILLASLLILLPTVSNADRLSLKDNSPNLAQALAAVQPTARQLALAVGAESISLPVDSAAPDATATVPQVAQVYGGIAQNFGMVTAVAPTTIPVLNPNPHDPNIYQGMTPEEVLALFAASLDNSQWRALTDEKGLGYTALNSDDQRAIFQALFPNGKLILHRSPTSAEQDKQYFATAAAGGKPDDADKALDVLDQTTRKDHSNELSQARLRLAKHMTFGISSPDGTSITQTDPDKDTSSAEHWEFAQDHSVANTYYGVVVRAMQPNVLKPADVNYDESSLNTVVSVLGCKRVGDLVTAISKATGLELYVDRRWEAKSLTIVGAQTSAPARDILHALALCLGGTYRRVGTAYVLTDDLIGTGTIRQRWVELQTDAEARKVKVLTDAQQQLGKTHSWQDLSWTGDPLDPTVDQQKQAENSKSEMVRLPYDQLDPAQQAFIKGFIDQRQQLHTDEATLIQQYPAFASGLPMSTAVPAPGGRVTLVFTPRLELLLPSLKEPVTMPVQMFPEGLFGHPDTQREVPVNDAQGMAEGNAPKLAAMLRTIPYRAVLAHPQSPAEVDRLVALMKKTGMNALYLDVFSGGVSRLTAHPNILDEALARTRGTGIVVYPTLNLYNWDSQVRAEVTDLSILGETSLAALIREQFHLPSDFPSQPAPLFVSPSAAEVRQTLLHLTHQALRPGIAGIVWRDAAVPGYAPGDDFTRLSLGYLESARLSFLRKNHADPLDISPGFPTDQADLTIPGFDENATNVALEQQWETTRVNARLALLRSMHTETGVLPILAERDTKIAGTDDWYGSWDSPQATLPEFHGSTEDVQSLFAWGQAKAQSHLTMRVISPQDLLTANSGTFLQTEFPQGRWGGFVLDSDAPATLSNATDHPQDLTSSLEHLANVLHHAP